MFRNDDRKTPTQNLHRRIYCALFMMLLAAGNVVAEDDVADLDPNGNSVVGVFRDLWNYLVGMIG